MDGIKNINIKNFRGIDHLTIEGEMSDELEGEIWKHFPKAILNYKGAASRGIVSGTVSDKYIPIERRRQTKGKGLPIPQREIYMQEIEYVDMELTGKPVPR